jgi:putative redox protein
MEYRFEEPLHAAIGNMKYQCTIRWRNGEFIADEPETSGGKDLGPDPYVLLLSSLASCTLITLRMYIDQKGWDIPSIAVNANMFRDTKDGKDSTVIDCDLVFTDGIPDEQKVRLQEIATHCPISRLLEGSIKVRTFLFRDADTERKIPYAGDEITVVWKPEFCQHSARCFTQLPEVFDPKVKKWINPGGASTERIIEQVKKCPSGALTYFVNEKSNKAMAS